MAGGNRSVSVSLGANPAGFIAGMARAGTAAEGLDAKTAMLSKSMKLLGGVFIADKVVHGFLDAAKAAGTWQAQMTRLQTDANESGKNLGMVSKGLLDLAGATGNSTDALAAGMYKIESAGIHGADALKVAKAAAEGAKIGFADMTVVADALTTAMVDYHLPASKATATTNELIAAVSRGKTDLESLSASLSTVAPVAHAAGIGLAETLGAMSTMTAQGTPAAKAATYLAQTIKSIEAPTQKSAKELDAIGLSAANLSTHLGDRGLANTLDLITGAIRKKMGPAGDVMLANLQKLSGKTSDFQKILADVPPGMQSYVQALALSTGSTKTLQAVLELVSGGTGTFRDNTKAAGDAAKHAGKDVHDWDVVQKNFNNRLSEAHGQFEKVKITLGQDLLPLFTSGAKKLADFGKWLGKYPTMVKDVTFAVAGAGGLLLSMKLLNAAIDIVRGTMARTIGLRAASTAGLLAESAAADKAAVSIAALDVAEGSSIGLRTPLTGPLGRLGLAGAAATGGETAAIGGAQVGALTVGGALAIGGALTIAGAATFASVKIANWAYNSTPAGKQQNGGGAPMGNGPGGKLTSSEQSGYADQYLAAAGLNPDGSKRDDKKFSGDVSKTRLLTTSQYQDLFETARVTDKMMKSLTTTFNEQVPSLQTLGKAYSQDKTWMALTAQQADQLMTAQNKIGPATTNLTGLIKKQTDAFSVLNVAGQNAIVANENYQASIAGLSNSVKENGTSLDQNTVKGRANTDAIIAQAGAINEVDTAYFDAQAKSKGYKVALGEVTTKLQGQKDALVQQATRLGISEGAAKKLVDQILKTPKQVTTDFQSPELVAMSKKVDDLQNAINQLTGKPYHITVTADLPKSLQSTYSSQVPNGTNAATGFAAGIKHASGAPTAAAQAMAKSASDAVAAFNESHSPSKLYARHGYNAGTGLAKGMKDSTKHATAAAKKLAAAAAKALRDATAAERRSISLEIRGWLADVNKDIATTKHSLSKDQSALESWRNNRDQAGANAKGVFAATGDLSTITGAMTKNWDGTTSTAPVTAADINQGLSSMRAKDKTFLEDLKRLKKLGLGQSTLTQILNMGPDAGDEYAKAILSGGVAEVKQVNGLEGGINTLGVQAASMAEAPFNKHIADLTAKVVDLTAQLKKEEAARDKAKTLSLTINSSDTQAQLKQIEAAVEKALGIKLHLKSVGG